LLFSMFEEPFLSPENNLWFFLSGHGVRHDERDYLLPIDANPRYIDDTAITIDFVTRRLSRSGAGNIVLILDFRRIERKRVAGEQREKERLEAERREKERLAAEQREKERLEAEARQREIASRSNILPQSAPPVRDDSPVQAEATRTVESKGSTKQSPLKRSTP
jgi:uncharacterized caspase-like protein